MAASVPMTSLSPPDRPVSGVVVAVKDLSRAKTRMTALPAALRGRLAALMAVSVARAWGEVVDRVALVTTAPGIGPLLAAYGVEASVVADPRAGLNPAFGAGEQALRDAGCELVVACMADLPALTAGDVADVVNQCAGTGRWFVRDAAGTGTTLLAARGVALAPAFGPDSAARHLKSGAVELEAADGVRLDADEPADLLRAAGLDLQEPVAALVDGSALARHTTATVVGAQGAGWELLLASGSRAYASAAASGPELKRLVQGQRVHVVRGADGGVRHLWI